MGKEIKLTKDIYWVGKVDNREVPFHRLILAKEQLITRTC